MALSGYSLSALRLEDVKEAKCNLPRWDDSANKFQAWHNAFLYLAYCLHVSDFLSGSSHHSLPVTALVRPYISSPDSDSDSDGEDMVSAVQPAPVHSLCCSVATLHNF